MRRPVRVLLLDGRRGLFRLLFLMLLLNLLGSGDIRAQQEDADTVGQSLWKTDLVSKITAAQTGYRNWQKGGVNTLALTTSLDGNVSRISGIWEQKHEMRLMLGLVKQDTLAFRKADDQILFNSSLQYSGNGFFRHFNPTVALQVRTQFAPGYEYKRRRLNQDPPVKVSDFLSPLTLTQTVGLSYNPTNWFAQRLGVGGKETFVAIERFRPLYLGADSLHTVQVELGIESKTEFKREIVENVRLESTLGIFAALLRADVPDVIWENDVVMKVNSWLSVNFDVDVVYDRDVLRAIQLREVFALGVSIILL